MIVVDHLCKQFDHLTAVNDLSFSVAPGEILGFLGPNGAGKSTTMKMLTGFIQPSSGRISVLGHDVATDALGAQQRIGYLPEGAPCYDEMTPRQFLRFIAEVRQIAPDERQQRIREVVDTLALDAVLDQRIETLSKGFKRRVGLAQAIIHDPDVLILDEPTDGLDPNQKHQVRKLIEGLSRDKIVIISTHILEEVTAVCTRAIIIAEGCIVSDCSPTELEARSRHHRALTLGFASTDAAQAVADRLQGLSGVQEVETDDTTVVVIPAGEDLPLGEILQQLNDAGAVPTEMFQQRGRLDEVFRLITGGQA